MVPKAGSLNNIVINSPLRDDEQPDKEIITESSKGAHASYTSIETIYKKLMNKKGTADRQQFVFKARTCEKV